MSTKLTIQSWALLAILAVATATLTWRAKSLEKRVIGTSDQPAMTHEQAPEFHSQSLTGQTISTGDFKGKKKLVVSFWASWCEPCRMEMPDLKDFYERYHTPDSQFEVVGISTDDDRFQAEKYVKSAQLPFPIVWDENGGIASAYHVDAIPVMYVIDENGKVVFGQSGYDGGAMDSQLKRILGIKDPDAKKAETDDGSH